MSNKARNQGYQDYPAMNTEEDEIKIKKTKLNYHKAQKNIGQFMIGSNLE